MCRSCWNSAGRPAIDNEKVREAARLAEGVYEQAGAGGRLHILLDDWNTDEDSVRFILEWMPKHPVPAEQDEAEQRCISAFQSLTEPERYSVLALLDGYWR